MPPFASFRSPMIVSVIAGLSAVMAFFEVVPPDEVRATLLVEAPGRRGNGRMGLDANAVVRHEVRHPLERGLVLSARLVVEFAEVRD
jgi:hypothetical protein